MDLDDPVPSIDYSDHNDLGAGALRIHAASEHDFTIDVDGPSPLHDVIEAKKLVDDIVRLATRPNRDLPYRWLIKIQVRDHHVALIAHDLIPGHTPEPEEIHDGLDAARRLSRR